MSTAQVNDLVKLNGDTPALDDAVVAQLGITLQQFKNQWVKKGLGKDSKEVWYNLLSSKYRELIAKSVSNSMSSVTDRQLKMNFDAINNSPALSILIENVAASLTGKFFIGTIDIEAAIRKEVMETYNNNRVYYAKEFKIEDRDYDVNPVLLSDDEDGDLDYTVSRNDKVTSWKEALNNNVISQDQTRIILGDIAATYEDFKLNANQGTVTADFTMYESFLRTHFLYEMEHFNNEFKGVVKISIGEATESKYKKADDLMYLIYKDFLYKGINRHNFDEFQNLVTHAITKPGFTINNVAAMIGFSEIKDSIGVVGRAVTGYKLSSPKSVEKYDRLMLGLIALSNLVIHLRKAGVSPYDIDPLIFSNRVILLQNKFLSIAHFVEYNRTMLEVIDKYGHSIEKNLAPYDALRSSHPRAGLIIGNSKQNVRLLNNRRDFSNFSQSIIGLVRSKTSTQMVVSEMKMQGPELMTDLFKLIQCIEADISPFATIVADFPSNVAADKLHDYDPASDEDYVFDYQSSEIVFGLPEDFPYKEFKVPKSEFRNFAFELEKAVEPKMGIEFIPDSSLTTLFTDLAGKNEEEFNANIKILNSCYKFVLDFTKFMDNFLEDFDSYGITYVDYATAICKDELFEPLHEILNPEEELNDDDVIRTMAALLKRYDATITEEAVSLFKRTPTRNQPLFYFKNQLFARTFTSLRDHFISAKAGLFNLTEEGKPVRLTGNDLLEVLNNQPVLDRSLDQFLEKFKNFAQDSDGYFINKQGNLLYVTHKNNVAGALHSTGIVIYTDKTSEPFSRF